MSIRVTAVKTLRYGGKSYSPGQSFDANPRHAKVLALIKKVKITTGVEAPAKVEAKKVVEKKVEAKVEKVKSEAKPVKDTKVGAQVFDPRGGSAEEKK